MDMMMNLKQATAIAIAIGMLAGCEVEVTKDDVTGEALAAAETKLAAAEAKLGKVAEYDEQIAAVNTWIEIWGSADVDKLDAVAMSDYSRTAPDLNANSLDEVKAFMLQVHAAYPDYKITNDGIVAGPDGVFVQWTVTGSDTGRGEDATGNALRVTGISRYWFSDGKIARELVIFDTGAVLTQLETAEMPHTAD